MRFLSTLAASVLGTLIAFGVVALFLFFFFLVISLSADQQPQVRPSSVLAVNVDGPIPERTTYDPFFRSFEDGPAYDLRGLTGALRKAAVDERIEAVWLRLKGTSAGWATLEEVRNALVRFRQSGKPLIASSEDFGMGEKEYFLATAADSIFAAPMAPFEYNGFFITQPFFEGTLEKFDLEPKIVRVGAYKSAVEPFLRDDLSAENREQLSALLETQNTRFKNAVSATRGLSPDSLEQLADTAALFEVERAVDLGLIDGLRYYDEMIDLFRERLGFDPDAELPQIDVGDYARVPADEAGLEQTGDGEIAIVYAEGTIQSGETEDAPFAQTPSAIGSATFREAMQQARTSSQTKAVVIRINSGGGSAAASESMWHAVKLTAEEKPVVVSMGDVAASGGYYIAAAADTIVADSTTITGSIGIFGFLFFDTSAFFNNELGVTFDGVQTSPLSDYASITTSLSEEERRLIGRAIEQGYDTFLARVAAGRGMDTSAVNAVAQGRVWSGQDAKRVGLVDVIGGLEDALQIAGQAAGLGDGPYRTRVLPRPKTFFERLNESLSGQAARLWTNLTASPLEQQVHEQRRVLERLVGQPGTLQARLPYDIRIE